MDQKYTIPHSFSFVFQYGASTAKTQTANQIFLSVNFYGTWLCFVIALTISIKTNGQVIASDTEVSRPSRVNFRIFKM